jgi:hypothetical protein
MVSRIALLFGKWTHLGVVQHICKMKVPGLDISAIDVSMRKFHYILVIGPLISDKQRRPFFWKGSRSFAEPLDR